jgi:hypothetical protein
MYAEDDEMNRLHEFMREEATVREAQENEKEEENE